MIRRVILSIVVAVVVAVVVRLLGNGLVDAGAQNTGGYLTAVAVLLGITAGIWFFLTNPYPRRPL
jgi:hypothetical protein